MSIDGIGGLNKRVNELAATVGDTRALLDSYMQGNRVEIKGIFERVGNLEVVAEVTLGNKEEIDRLTERVDKMVKPPGCPTETESLERVTELVEEMSKTKHHVGMRVDELEALLNKAMVGAVAEKEQTWGRIHKLSEALHDFMRGDQAEKAKQWDRYGELANEIGGVQEALKGHMLGDDEEMVKLWAKIGAMSEVVDSVQKRIKGGGPGPTAVLSEEVHRMWARIDEYKADTCNATKLLSFRLGEVDTAIEHLETVNTHREDEHAGLKNRLDNLCIRVRSEDVELDRTNEVLRRAIENEASNTTEAVADMQSLRKTVAELTERIVELEEHPVDTEGMGESVCMFHTVRLEKLEGRVDELEDAQGDGQPNPDYLPQEFLNTPDGLVHVEVCKDDVRMLACYRANQRAVPEIVGYGTTGDAAFENLRDKLDAYYKGKRWISSVCCSTAEVEDVGNDEGN